LRDNQAALVENPSGELTKLGFPR